MGRPRKRPREQNQMGEEEDNGAMDGDCPDDSRQAVAVGSDTANGYLDLPISRPLSTTDTETLDISAWDRTFDTRQSSHPSAAWAVVQSSNTNGRFEGSVSQISLPRTEEANHVVDSESSHGNLTALPDADVFTLLTHIQERWIHGEKITYRVGDASQANAHLHTGTPECPMGFHVELESEEWAAMARKVVKQDVYGNAQNIDCLIGVVEELEQRQHIWHLLRPFSLNASCTTEQPDDAHKHNGFCLQLTGRIRAAIDALQL
ncbi:MAG: hypothetical protein Q9207_003478 [Kuettlingeria erythrocarpa]